MSQTGVISYAGLDETALLEAARRALSREDGDERFRAFLPLFPAELVVDMPYVGHVRAASPLGFSLDADVYHAALSARLPDLYAGENRRRCFGPDGAFRGGVVTVDESWAGRFVQYRPFLGDRLILHLLGGGHQAVAVPVGLYPRLGAWLCDEERALGVTGRAQDYCAWMLERLSGGARDARALEADYLRRGDLRPFGMDQQELARTMQDVALLMALQGGQPAPLYTEACRQAARIAQYVPFRRACDHFEPAPLTRQTSRLAQLYTEGDEFQSDFWLPWQDAQAYLDKRRSVLDTRALCEAFQIAPALDADSRGGVYPNRVRVVSVADHTLVPLAADVLNNPAYGGGMNRSGLISRLIYLPQSAALLRDGRLTLENHNITCENTRVTEAEVLRMRARAECQEHKGRLIDALYQRESALGRMRPGTLAYERARELLDARVTRMSAMVRQASAEDVQLSGYDADIAYLRRLEDWREGRLDEEPAPDAKRQASVEGGFAMRALPRGYALADLCPKPARERAAREEPRTRRGPDGRVYEQMDFWSGAGNVGVPPQTPAGG